MTMPSAKKTKELFDEFRWNGFEYPSYSPDLACIVIYFPIWSSFLVDNALQVILHWKKVTMVTT